MEVKSYCVCEMVYLITKMYQFSYPSFDFLVIGAATLALTVEASLTSCKYLYQ